MQYSIHPSPPRLKSNTDLLTLTQFCNVFSNSCLHTMQKLSTRHTLNYADSTLHAYSIPSFDANHLYSYHIQVIPGGCGRWTSTLSYSLSFLHPPPTSSLSSPIYSLPLFFISFSVSHDFSLPPSYFFIHLSIPPPTL